MSDDYSSYDKNPADLRKFLADEQANGFLNLPQEHRVFALEFVKSASLYEACKAIGTNTQKGGRLIRDPLVAAFINHLNRQKEHLSLIDASFIEVQYLRLFAQLTGEEAVYVPQKEGYTELMQKFHGSEAVSCLRDMAKISGHYKEDATFNLRLVGDLTDEQKSLLDKAFNEQF